MRLFVWIAAVGVLGAVAFVGGCSRGDGAGARAGVELDPVVRTSMYPVTYFARRIAGGLVRVECPLPAGEDPIFWSPTAEVIAQYQRAQLVVFNGAGLERWVAAAALPRSRVVEASAGLSEGFIEIKGSTHSHGPKGAHSHAGVDGHTWMDPVLAIEQSRAIEAAMNRAFPEHGDVFSANLDGLVEDLGLLDVRFAGLETGGASLIASHPAYNYLSRRYSWNIQSLDLDPGAAMTDQQLDAVRSMVKAGTRGVVLWESEPTDATVEALTGAGLASAVFSPAENPGRDEGGDEGDYLAIMRGNIERLRTALGG